jgi:ribosome maturation factor RimP
MESTVNPDLYNLVVRVVSNANLELVHCEFAGQKSAALRIYIDKPGGVTHEDCQVVSEQLSVLLDVEDLIPQHYTLEVSSPGVERGLYKPEDFVKFAGQRVRLRTREAIAGRRKFQGLLIGLEGDLVKLTDKTETFLIPYAIIQGAKLDVDVRALFQQAEILSQQRSQTVEHSDE